MSYSRNKNLLVFNNLQDIHIHLKYNKYFMQKWIRSKIVLVKETQHNQDDVVRFSYNLSCTISGFVFGGGGRYTPFSWKSENREHCTPSSVRQNASTMDRHRSNRRTVVFLFRNSFRYTMWNRWVDVNIQWYSTLQLHRGISSVNGIPGKYCCTCVMHLGSSTAVLVLFDIVLLSGLFVFLGTY